MKKIVTTVTISALTMLILSCSQLKTEETISFEQEPSFSLSIDRVMEDKLTMVLAVDDSASMVAKTEELEQDMKALFTDLIDAKWDMDIHLVTCAFYKGVESDMKSVSTEDFKDLNTEEKVNEIMTIASPKIDLSTLQNDADERCNQSLEKAWNLLEPKNTINLSLIISNEDGCGRDTENESLVHLNGNPRNNCSPITYNQIQSTFPADAAALKTKNLDGWIEDITKYSNDVWIPWFDNNIKNKVHSAERYVEFFKNLEENGKKSVENFSHIYLPIVVDSETCLAKTLIDQFNAKEENARQEALEKHEASDSDEDFVFGGLNDTRNLLANIGHSYLKTFDLLNQDIEFKQENGDLSLCEDLSHIVGKISREIKLRGSGVIMDLPRPIDVKSMITTKGKNFNIIRIQRPADVEAAGFFEARNEAIKKAGLEWKKINETHWSIEIGFESSFVKYSEKDMSVELLTNKYLSITGGDEIFILNYEPIGFKE